MKKVGRNDACPCGSGKKYKKCCLRGQETPKVMSDFDKLINSHYARIKNINNRLLTKANDEDYARAEFNDAMDLSITSNTLSLMKSFLQKEPCALTSALNMRNILESYVFILMNKAGDLTNKDKELFSVQYKLLEYTWYKSDGYYSPFIADKEKLRQDYDDALSVYSKYGYNENDAKAFAKTRAPFLCNKRFNFNSLIEKYLPNFKFDYATLSMMIHPSSNRFLPSSEVFRDEFMTRVLSLVGSYYEKRELHNFTELDFYSETALIYGASECARQLFDIQKEQVKLLTDLASVFHDNDDFIYIESFLVQLSRVIYDINTDSFLGYSENVKLKFKVIAEMLASFDKVYFNPDVRKGGSSCFLAQSHDFLINKETIGKNFPETPLEVPEDFWNTTYSVFKNIHPNSTLDIEKFKKSFSRPNGFLIDEKGKTPTLTSLAQDYVIKTYNEIMPMFAEKPINLTEHYKVLYLESQYMSHGCGYLYFSNHGAWAEDITVIYFLDTSLVLLLNNLETLWKVCGVFDERNRAISEKIDGIHKKMMALVDKKIEIFKKTPRIHKPF